MGRLPVLLKRHWPALGFAALLAAGFAALASGSSAQIEAALLALAAFGFVVHWRSARGMTYRDARARSRTTRLSHKTRTLDILYEVVASLNMSSNRYELFLDFLSSLATLLDASAAQLRLLSAEATSDHVASHGDFAAALADWGLQDIERQLQRQVTDSGRVLLHPLAAGTPERLAPELVVAPIQYRGQVMGTFSVLLPRSSREF
ncbi:MAG: hypothetical protein LJE84_00200, partial [Gammaproteobacteria bacterium]|nr:hypothetical protein [Gammaproteobacteria bacterium]